MRRKNDMFKIFKMVFVVLMIVSLSIPVYAIAVYPDNDGTGRLYTYELSEKNVIPERSYTLACADLKNTDMAERTDLTEEICDATPDFCIFFGTDKSKRNNMLKYLENKFSDLSYAYGENVNLLPFFGNKVSGMSVFTKYGISNLSARYGLGHSDDVLYFTKPDNAYLKIVQLCDNGVTFTLYAFDTFDGILSEDCIRKQYVMLMNDFESECKKGNYAVLAAMTYGKIFGEELSHKTYKNAEITYMFSDNITVLSLKNSEKADYLKFILQ